jgi:putative transposase
MEQTEKMLDELISRIKTPEEFYRLQDTLKKRGIEALLNAEMTEHLGYEKHQKAPDRRSNSRNGSSKKGIKTAQGEIEISVPRDRDSSFEPVLVPKHRRISEDLEQVILHLYAKGVSTEDISDHMERIYGVAYSASAISNITHQLMKDIEQWQQRPLEKVYPVIWLDAIRYKIKQDSKVLSKAVLLAIGLKLDGKKEILGLWVYQTESAAFWMEVLNEIKMRGTEDLFIVCSDNLPGLTEAIASVYPEAVTQICIVHQIRNSLRHVSWKDRKPLADDLKEIYQAINNEAALTAFETFKLKWSSKYGYAVKSWEKNWENLTHFLSFPVEIRKIIYTTNTIESFNAVLRKFTKNKKVFPTDDAAVKSIWLAVQQITSKWTMPIRDWGLIINQFSILFHQRLNLNL